jgi:hypothetical protein
MRRRDRHKGARLAEDSLAPPNRVLDQQGWRQVPMKLAAGFNTVLRQVL